MAQRLVRTLDLTGALPLPAPPLVPPVYLGMPPLPLSGVKYAATAGIRGVGDGRVEVAIPTKGTKVSIFPHIRSVGRRGKKRPGANDTATEAITPTRGRRPGRRGKGLSKRAKASKKGTKAPRGIRGLKRAGNGRFLKRGT